MSTTGHRLTRRRRKVTLYGGQETVQVDRSYLLALRGLGSDTSLLEEDSVSLPFTGTVLKNFEQACTLFFTQHIQEQAPDLTILQLLDALAVANFLLADTLYAFLLTRSAKLIYAELSKL